MMVLRLIVGIVAMLIILGGLAQIILPAHVIVGLTSNIMQSRALALTGVVSVIIGVLFLVAVFARQVSLSAYVLILGLYALVAGILLLIFPGHARSLTDAIFLKQTTDAQTLILWLSGILRILIGVGLLYAASEPARRVERVA